MLGLQSLLVQDWRQLQTILGTVAGAFACEIAVLELDAEPLKQETC